MERGEFQGPGESGAQHARTGTLNGNRFADRGDQMEYQRWYPAMIS